MATETVPAAAALAPVALLHELTRWMESAQYGADHPWRVAITETLVAQSPGGEPTVADKSRNQPAPLSPADKSAEILGDMSDVIAMLQGACAVLEVVPHRECTEAAERLLMLAKDRLAETYQTAETLTAELDDLAMGAVGGGQHSVQPPQRMR